MPSAPTLYLDTASPIVSVAIGCGQDVLAEQKIELRRSSEKLLQVIETLLDQASLDRHHLGGVVALQGPGSFTGLRIGLATAFGLHQGLGIRATAQPTLPILAAAAGPGPVELLAVVDAIRGEWATQAFTGGAQPEPRGAPELLTAAQLRARAPSRIIGFGVGRLASEQNWPANAIELIEPPPLAPVAARFLANETLDWDASRLTAPIYFRPPAVTPPAKPS